MSAGIKRGFGQRDGPVRDRDADAPENLEALADLPGHWIDAVAIFGIAIFNAFISFWQEFKAEQSLAALREMSAPQAIVRRNGEESPVPASDLVPGDILIVKTGDILAADILRLPG